MSNNYIVTSGVQKFNPITAQFGGMYDFQLIPRARVNPNQETFGTVGDLLFRILRPATSLAGRFGTAIAWLLTPSVISPDSDEFAAQVDLEIMVYHAHNEPHLRLENIPVQIDPRNRQDNVVSGYNSPPAMMDRGPLITQMHNRERNESMMLHERPNAPDPDREYHPITSTDSLATPRNSLAPRQVIIS